MSVVNFSSMAKLIEPFITISVVVESVNHMAVNSIELKLFHMHGVYGASGCILWK